MSTPVKTTGPPQSGSTGAPRDQPAPAVDNTPTPTADPPKTNELGALIPSWIMAGLRSKRMWKNWARCMIATLATMILMVAGPTSRKLGQATFFGLIASMILPPSMPVSILFFALLTMGLGMLIGWAWGTAAWAAGLSVRSQALLQTQIGGVQAQAQAAGIDTATAVQASIFKGVFLDPRSSAVHGIFIFLGCYFFAWIRATKPKLTLLTIFGTIILDMTCSFGPLFPMAYYMLPTTLIRPAAAYMAVAICCAILFFPQSLNHLIMDALVHQTLQPMCGLLKWQEEILESDPTRHEEWHALAQKSRTASTLYMQAYSGVEAQAKMLQLEVTRGRISAGQLESVLAKTRALAGASLGLITFVTMVDERDRALKEQMEDPLPHATVQSKSMYHELVQAEKSSGRNLEDLMPQLKSETAELRSAAEVAFQGGIDYLDMVNSTRWKKTPKDFYAPEVRQANLLRLRAALGEFRVSGGNQALSKFKDHFDPQTGRLLEWGARPGSGSPRGLFRCFQFTASLTAFCIALIDWLQLIEVIELGTPNNKFQFPGKFVQEVVRNVNDNTAGSNDFDLSVRDNLVDNGGDVDSDADDPTLNDDDSEDSGKRRKQSHNRKGDQGADLKSKLAPRDPDAGAPGNVFQKFGHIVSKIVRGMTGDNGIFALKYGIVTLAIWIISVCPSSAEFFYMNRGLWALIMAQTGLGIFTGEQVYNFVTRMTGTCIGAVIGMVLWYIGAQRGLGEPYGVTAACVIGVAPFLWLRIAAPPNVMSFYVMVAVTIVFVVGYSWVDNHIPQSANQGAGYTLAARRALLVIVGFAAAFVMILIPKPISAKKVVRQGIAKNIAAIGDLYALELSALEQGRTDDATKIDASERRARYRQHFLRIFGRIQALQQRIGFASLEPAMRGPWPKEKYEKLVRIQESMLGASALLSAAYSQLEPKWCERITDHSEVMHPAFMADCFSLFTILRHSLRQGTALPPIIPIFERLAYHREYRQARKHAFSVREHAFSVREQDHPDDGSDADDLLPTERAALSSLKHDLTWENAHDEQFTLYATALIAISHFIGGLNALHSTILSLVGEREIDGFDDAQQRWAQAVHAV